MTQQLIIESYFSLPTDLAGEMSNWPEFVSGEGYSVDLKDSSTGVAVTVRLMEENESFYVTIDSPVTSQLFDQVAGRVINALAAKSDCLMVRKGS